MEKGIDQEFERKEDKKERKEQSNEINTVLVLAVLASMYRSGTYIDIEMLTFRTGLNIGCTSHTS